MTCEKIATYPMEKCYSIAPFRYREKDHILVAAEKTGDCVMFDLDGNYEETVWKGPSGTMSMVQLPGKDGMFLATREFFSPNDSKESRIAFVFPDAKGNFQIQTLLYLPHVHRFQIVTRNGIHYLVAATLMHKREFKDDWNHPGKVYACRLPEDLSPYNENNPLKMEVILDGLLKNHGYCNLVENGVESAVVGTDNGVFKLTPPENADGSWEIEHLLNAAVSDMIFVDFDEDGEDEMLTIEPFHGQKIAIYKKQDGLYQKIYGYGMNLEFAHGIYPCMINGKPTGLIGHREGKRCLLAFTCIDKDHLEFKAEVLDQDVGPANIFTYEKDGSHYIVSTNREINEIAFYLNQA